MSPMSAEVTSITLPAELRPRDGRFGSGPSKVRPEAVAALTQAGDYLGTSHRREGVRSVVRRIRTGMAELFGLPDGYEVLVGVGGATAFFDAAAFGLIERRSRHAVFGEFSQKFADAVRAPHLDAPEVVASDPGTHPELGASETADVYALTHNETSTGVAMPVHRPADDGLVVVDATSAAGGMRVDPRECDVYFFSPQKAFAADAGLWVALASPAAVERIERIEASGRWTPESLRLATALENSRKDQTYNTPPLATLALLADTTEWMLAGGGLEWAASRCDRSAEILYGWAERGSYTTPFVGDPGMRSHTVATIDFDGSVDAGVLAGVLRDNGVLDTEPYRKLARNQLRIALFPAIEPDDVEILTRAIDHIVGELRGSG